LYTDILARICIVVYNRQIITVSKHLKCGKNWITLVLKKKVVFNSECGLLKVRLIHNEIICFGPKIRGLNIVLGTDLLKHLRTH